MELTMGNQCANVSNMSLNGFTFSQGLPQEERWWCWWWARARSHWEIHHDCQ